MNYKLLKIAWARPTRGLAPAEVEIGRYILKCNKDGKAPTRDEVIEAMKGIYSNKNIVICAIEGLIESSLVKEVEPDVFNIY